MKNLSILLHIIILYGSMKAQTPAVDPHWNLLWEDDFNSLNTYIWNVRHNFDHYGNEGQVYTNRANNVFINNGNLILRCINETYSCPTSDLYSWGCSRQLATGLDYQYTSGYIQTKTAYDLKYGYVESRMKLPNYDGLWPAFWTQIGVGSTYEEIDVFEMTPGLYDVCDRTPSQHLLRNKYIMGTNLHIQNPTASECLDQHAFPSTIYIQDYTQWHTYGLEWSPSKIVWYIDGYPVRCSNNPQISSRTNIILNLAVIDGFSPTSPADMIIDYVKVYEMKKDCNDYINAFNYDFLSYNNREKNFIKIGEGGGYNSVPSGHDVKLRASQFVDFGGDFNVPLGSGIFADAGGECEIDLNSNCSQAFSPCTYNFSTYDNSLKEKIDLGFTGCNVSVVPGSYNLFLHSTKYVNLDPGVTISPTETKFVSMAIFPCPN